MFLIADTHAGAEGNPDDFLAMLKALEETTDDIVFLGDVFDLWIGLARYETDLHRQFLDWCKAQCSRRRVGLIEGNHEFYIGKQHSDSFTWVSDTEHRDGDLVFAHGDLINADDVSYRRFRRLIRNAFTRWFAVLLPFGPTISHMIKRKSKGTNKAYRGVLPVDALNTYAESLSENDVKHAFLGHFHRDYQTIAKGGCTLHLIPGWFVKGEIARFNPDSETVELIGWRDVAGGL